MSSMMKKVITVKTKKRNELIDVTGRVKEVISESNVKDGFILLYVPHTTAAVAVNESHDPSVARDISNKLSDLIPQGAGYSHREGNADSHIKSTIVGCSEFIPVKDGTLELGRWQGIFFCEFDGPRSRRLIIEVND